jgi:hypothetical protein
MMSALECFQKAAHCEAFAQGCHDHIDAGMLRETAKHWRTLAAAAEAAQNPATAAAVHRRGTAVDPVW